MEIKKDKILNVCYVADHRYAPIAAVSIVSLLDSNRQFDITIHFIDTGLEEIDRERLKKIEDLRTGIKILFYDGNKIVNIFKQTGCPSFLGNYSTYARLGICSFLPKTVEKILYIDSDTLIMNDLYELFNRDINAPFCAVQDIVDSDHKKSLNLTEKWKYINAGVLMINTCIWNNLFSNDRIKNNIKFIAHSKYPDQDLINLISSQGGYSYKSVILDLSYNVLTPFIEWKLKYLKLITPEIDELVYSDFEIERAISEPRIVHIVDGVLGRPWIKNNDNKYKDLWFNYMRKTQFINDFELFSDNSTNKQKLFRILFKFLPQNLCCTIVRLRKTIMQ